MPVVPASHTFVAAVATTSEANTFIRDPIAFALKPPIAELRQTAGQTLTTGVGSAITFTAEVVDTDVDGIGGHDNVTNPSRYTARYAGWYQVAGMVLFAANATGRRLTWWVVNGTAVPATEVAVAAAPSAGGGTGVAARVVQVFLAVGDYVELFAKQESGGNLNTDSFAGTAAMSGASIRWVSN